METFACSMAAIRQGQGESQGQSQGQGQGQGQSRREGQGQVEGEGQGKRSSVGCSRLVVAVNGGLEASDTDSFQDSSLRLGGSVRQGGGQAGSQSRSSSLLRQQPHIDRPRPFSLQSMLALPSRSSM